MLERRSTYPALYDDFRWDIPDRFNIGTAIADAWAAIEPDRVALLEYRGRRGRRARSPMANSPASPTRWRRGCAARGSAAATAWRCSCRSASRRRSPMRRSTSSVPSRCRWRCCSGWRRSNTGCRRPACGRWSPMPPVSPSSARSRRGCPRWRRSSRSTARTVGRLDFRRLVAGHAGAGFDAEPTRADDPAMMIFTSGTTGPPKGALHGHRVLLGHLPGVQMPHEFLPQPHDRLWTPADWAWAGGLLNVLLARASAWRAGGVGPVREVRSRTGAAADGEDAGAQRLRAADGAAHDEVGDGDPETLPPRPAHRRLGRRVARSRDV